MERVHPPLLQTGRTRLFIIGLCLCRQPVVKPATRRALQPPLRDGGERTGIQNTEEVLQGDDNLMTCL